MRLPRTFIAFFLFGILLFASCKNVGDKKPKPLEFPEYTHNVEYIDSTKARLSKGFKVCNENFIAQYYNPEKATYSKTKKGLRDFILSNYENRGYTDSGYLNIRFVINCEGSAGRYDIHENKLDMETTPLYTDMVEHIFELTAQLKQWNPNVIRGNIWDSYMYLSYRIENGEITEILP